MKKVSCIRKGEKKIEEVSFVSLKTGDIFFSNGDAYKVDIDAHYSGDGVLFLVDTYGDTWYPHELDNGVKPYVITEAVGSNEYIPKVLHIEKNDNVLFVPDDFTACRLAEMDGVKLIYGMKHIPSGVYLDTPENRELISAKLEAVYGEGNIKVEIKCKEFLDMYDNWNGVVCINDDNLNPIIKEPQKQFLKIEISLR